MSSQLRLAGFFSVGLVLALPAAAQLDPGALRARFGEPLHRETFHVTAGFDVVVDYGPTSEVCQLQVPALMPTTEKISNADVMNRRMYAFLAELVPEAMRGGELGRFLEAFGAISVSVIDYEHVTISEPHDGQPFSNRSITLRFKRQDCQPTTGLK